MGSSSVRPSHPATGTAEREAAIKMIVRRSPGARRLTLGADKGYDTKNFVADLRDLNVAPHVAQNTTNRASAHDAASWLCCQPDHSQTDRGKLRLDQDDRRTAQNQTQGCGSRRGAVALFVGIRCGAISSDMKLSSQAARSIG